MEYRAGRGTIGEVDLDTLRVVATTDGPPGSEGFSVLAQHGVVFTVYGRDYTRGVSQLSARFNAQSLLEAARKEYTDNPDKADVAARYGLLTLRR
jgi:hypothetical protein